MIPNPCCCGPSCDIWNDPFASNLLASYAATGSWSVGSGVLTTGSAGALLIANATGTTGHGVASARVKLSAAAGKIGIIGAYDSGTGDYLLAELLQGSPGNLKLWQHVGGVDTQLDSFGYSAALNAFYGLCLEWNGASAAAVLSSGAAVAVASSPSTLAGNQAGLSASPNGGTATFDDFLFQKLSSDQAGCPNCPAPGCGCSFPFLGDMDVEVVGVTNGTCSTCAAQVNGLYTVPWVGVAGLQTCNWELVPSATNSCATVPQRISVSVFWDAGGVYHVSVGITVNTAFGGGQLVYDYTFTPPIDCSTLNLTIPFSGTNGSPACTGTGSYVNLASAA